MTTQTVPVLHLLLRCLALLILTHSLSFQPRRVRLAVDYGPRKIGLALSDFFGQVKPLQTIENTGNLTALSESILTRARSYGAIEVIVGLPADSDGVINEHIRNFNGQLCLNFSTVLATVANHHFQDRLRVFLVDERYTTREAKLRLKMEKQRASLDAMSAACLLERYLDNEGEGGYRPPLAVYPPPPDIAIFQYDLVKEYIRRKYFDEEEKEEGRERKQSDALDRVMARMRRREKPSSMSTTPTAGIGTGAGTVCSDSNGGGDGEMDADMAEMFAIRAARRQKGTLRKRPFS